MLRMFLVLGMILSSALQGVDRADVDLGELPRAALAQLQFTVAGTGDDQCCDQRQARADKPTICKPDCKAVIAAGVIEPHPRESHYDHPPQAQIVFLGNPVDLRPPIF